MKYLLLNLIIFLFSYANPPVVLSASTNHIVDARNMVILVNQDRINNHRSVLVENMLLDNSAQAKANDMCRQNYFSHWNPQGKSPWDFMTQAGYKYKYAGENLAEGYNEVEAEKAFMQSPSHRANILDTNYTDIGIGECGKYIVEQFGSR